LGLENLQGFFGWTEKYQRSHARPSRLEAQASAVPVSLHGIVNLTIDGHIEPAKPSGLCAHRFLPDLKDLSAPQSIMDRLHEVAAETKEILGEFVEREKPLSLSRRENPTHVTFPLASRFVRPFRPVVVST